MSVPNFVLAVQARDAAGARAALSPTFKGKANGKDLDVDGQMRLLEAWWTGFPAANFAMSPVGGSGRYVITWTLFGVHDGFYAGIPGTGKTVSFSGFIVAVADKTGIVSLDWKWDPKVFTKVVLGPDDVGTLEVKDNFRADPSRRWAHGDPRRGQGRKAKKPQHGKPPAGGRPAPTDGQAPADGTSTDPAKQPGQGRRRRGKGKPKADGAPELGAAAPPVTDAPSGDAAPPTPPTDAAAAPAPDGT